MFYFFAKQKKVVPSRLNIYSHFQQLIETNRITAVVVQSTRMKTINYFEICNQNIHQQCCQPWKRRMKFLENSQIRQRTLQIFQIAKPKYYALVQRCQSENLLGCFQCWQPCYVVFQYIKHSPCSRTHVHALFATRHRSTVKIKIFSHTPPHLPRKKENYSTLKCTILHRSHSHTRLGNPFGPENAFPTH